MNISGVWSSLRIILNENFSFNNIKEICGTAGFQIFKLHKLTQKLNGGATKGELLDGIDSLYAELESDDQNRLIISTIKEMLYRNESLYDAIEEILNRFGWGITNSEIHPLTLQLDIEMTELPENIQNGFKKCLQRYRDGDIAGAMTAICGIIDYITEEIYKKENIGNHKDASYHERVAKSLNTYEHSFKTNLRIENIEEKDIKLLWDNFSKSVKNAGYVLGAVRRDFSDAHGINEAPPEFLQIAINCAIFILRSFQLKKYEFESNHPYHELSGDFINFLKNCIVKPIGRKIVLNTPNDINRKFQNISFSKIDRDRLFRNGIINENSEITKKGIKILQAIAIKF